ncbi:hypothetical protein QQF64_029709 [Cirrhinus molitorella]|uniref:Uncharacterized protein n=1 Tax=Cirrhinus molitorella TaxID=172907 RepID=A0ABR3N1A9_9TELE
MTQCKAPVESDLCSCHCPYRAGPPWTSMPPSLTQRRAHWEKKRGECGTPAVDLCSAGNPSRQTTWLGRSRYIHATYDWFCRPGSQMCRRPNLHLM